MASLLYTVALGLLLVAATQSAPLAPMCAGYLGPDGEVAVRSSAASTSLCGASVPTNPAQFAAINLTYQAELHGGSANGVKGQNGWINIPLNQTSDVTIMVVDGFTPSCPPHTVNSTKPFEDTSYTTPYATASDKGAVLTLHLTEQFPCVPTFHFLLNGTTWCAKGDCGSGGIAVSWVITLCSYSWCIDGYTACGGACHLPSDCHYCQNGACTQTWNASLPDVSSKPEPWTRF